MKFMGYCAPRWPLSRSTNHRRGLGYRRTLKVEPLEDRRVLSVTISTAQLFDTLDGLIGTDADGVHDGILTVSGDLTIKNGGSINANDNWAGSIPNSDAKPPIVINVSGNLIIESDLSGEPDTGIFAENRTQGGHGADITLTVGVDFTMQNAATISSSDITLGGNPAGSGDITIDVTGNIDVQTGATISAGYFNLNNGSGGAILIQTQVGDIDIDGSVLSQSALTGVANQPPGGGTIFINAGVKDNQGSDLTISDTGIVSSKGRDPGADLVHLQGCEVTIYGLVESTGSGHSLPTNPPNHLDNHSPNNIRPDKPNNSTGGVEVWAGHTLTIDSTGTHNGEVNADIGITGGTFGIGWIDLFSRDGAIDIIGDITGPFAVHANGGLQQNTDDGGLITVKATKGAINASGQALQADAVSSGSDGGTILIEALKDIDLDAAIISAQGDSNPVGGLGDGGSLTVRSYAGGISWTSGAGNVKPDGTIKLSYFTTIALGASFPAGAPTQTNDMSGGAPTVPVYVVFPLCIENTFDFGDAPENPIVPGDYPTTLANDGARHIIVDGFHLGANIDAETDGQPNGTATGDDTSGVPDDEDGVVFNGPFIPGLTTSITVTLTDTIHQVPGGLLDAWFDWNGDGDWNDLGEQVFANQLLVAGANALNVNVPLTAVVSVLGAPTFARFRLSAAGNLAPTGEAADGEVEDYKLHIDPYWTSKGAVISQIEQNTRPPGNVPDSGECFAIPDVLVDVDNGPAVFDVTRVGTLLPATNSIQKAVDYVNAFGVSSISGVSGDVNGDGFLIVAVTAKDTLTTFTVTCGGETHTVVGRDLGGDGTENYVITNTKTARLNVFGNSVTMHAADNTKPVASIKGSIGKVTYLDVHTADSKVAGVLVGGPAAADKNADLVVVKNTNATNNKNASNTGVGIWVQDDNVQVTGSQHIFGNNIGIQIDGNNNELRTNNEIMDNNVLGIRVTGSNNELNDQDVGLSGHANGAGIDVTGSANNIHDGTISFNAGIGIRIAGSSNIVNQNDVLSNAKDAIYLALGSNSNQVTGNNIYSNGGSGVWALGSSNVIKKNKVGDKNKGNGGDGIHVEGSGNTVQENEIYSSLWDGLELIGDSNYIYKNIVGDKNKGGNGLSNIAGNRDGIRVTGKTNNLEANTTNANKGYGIYIAGATSTGNKLKDNKSNTDSSGGGNENVLAEFKFDAAITNLGGNKKDNANFTSVAAGTYE